MASGLSASLIFGLWLIEWHSDENSVRAGNEKRYTIPFEAHAYEALITTVKSLEMQEFDRVDKAVQVIL